MSFFDDPPAEPTSPARPEVPRAVPPWVGPADGVIPGVVALELLLARTDRLAVYLPELLVYPVGVSLRLLLLGRRPPSRGIESGPGTWRFGVQLSNGLKATSYGLGAHGGGTAGVGTTRGRSASGEPSAPILRPRGLSGGGTRWQVGYWLWPLPPPGDVTIACEWPDLAVELATGIVHGDRIHDAADRARDLWPADS